MEILSLVVAGAVVLGVWFALKGVATLVGLITLGGLAYYMHSHHPLWVDQVANAMQNWVI